MKRKATMTAAIILAMLLVCSCGGKQDETTPQTDAPQTEEVQTQEQTAPVTISGDNEINFGDFFGCDETYDTIEIDTQEPVEDETTSEQTTPQDPETAEPSNTSSEKGDITAPISADTSIEGEATTEVETDEREGWTTGWYGL